MVHTHNIMQITFGKLQYLLAEYIKHSIILILIFAKGTSSYDNVSVFIAR